MSLFWQKGNNKEEKNVADKSVKVAKKSSKTVKNKETGLVNKKELVKNSKETKSTNEKVSKGELVFPKDSVLKRPRVTEKAGILAEKGVYTFDVLPNANAIQIKAAIKAIYNVSPVKVSIAQIHPKTIYVRGRRSLGSKGKKAYVYLKKGDKIEFI